MNKWPGSGYVTSKVNLATSDITHVPKAFQLPGQEAEFMSYVSNPPVYKLVNKAKFFSRIILLRLNKEPQPQKNPVGPMPHTPTKNPEKERRK